MMVSSSFIKKNKQTNNSGIVACVYDSRTQKAEGREGESLLCLGLACPTG